ncbi:polysaccharide deacetylase [Solihabitans fulvus]|uniref:Polysaccharide deacetylase n=1 Tax=Solihabitans fulvus TaxID=1892852 RepID=A0A5B2XK30_9PSEU|nr:polysaccharide deacetylase [Solihabitans fulvus]
MRGGKRLGWLTTGVALALVLVVLAVLGAREPRPGQAAQSSWDTAPAVPLPSSSGPPAPTPTVPPPPAGQAPAWLHKLNPGEKPPQFLLFSFDGAASKEHWDRVLPIAKQVHAHVTGMLSGVYLLADGDADRYVAPGHDKGSSAIHFGGPPQDIATRIEYLNRALAEGHELGTHYNGHFCEADDQPSVGHWNTADWNSELDQFFDMVNSARQKGFALDPKTVRGGRTPCLEGDFKQLFPAMRQHGLVYDTSQVTLGVTWPTVQDGMWEFPMPEVRVPALGRNVVMMDYNLWFALNETRDEPARSAEFTKITLDTYRSVYQTAFNGNRAPLVIGNHFNDWNGSAFSNAVEQFMGEACQQRDTVCATYTEVIQWMQLQDPAVLDQLRRMPAARN